MKIFVVENNLISFSNNFMKACNSMFMILETTRDWIETQLSLFATSTLISMMPFLIAVATAISSSIVLRRRFSRLYLCIIVHRTVE